METKLHISKRIGHFPAITTSEENFKRLELTLLPNCPFENYSALDLLRDLFSMYGWMILPGHAYTLEDFLIMCNDIHAEYYRKILEGKE